MATTTTAATAASLRSDAPQQLPPFHLPPPPPQFHRISSCDRHPEQPVTGFCAACLRERLAGLDTATRRNGGGKAPSSASSAIKSVFFRGSGGNQQTAAGASSSSSSAFLLPQLRRCKSFSGGRGDGSYGPPPASTYEPQRRSCDVRVRNTLWSLFHLDDRDHRQDSSAAAHAAYAGDACEVEYPNLGFPPVATTTVHESRVEEEAEAEAEDEEDDDDEEFQEAAAPEDNEVEEDDGGDEIRAAAIDPVLAEEPKGIGEQEEARPMKEHIDLDAQTKKPPSKDLKEIAGSFWLAASVFSKKLQKWRRKQKLKKHGAGGSCSKTPSSVAAEMRAEKPGFFSRSRRFRETQSEVAEDVFGRRSCDTDPRFSLDAGRISFDDPRYSWDEPRASWDGYLVGGRSVFPRLPPMLSVVEDAPAPIVQRSDGLIPVEEDSTTPGGTLQTREYYLDTTQRRRRSLDRSSSVRKPVVVENEEPKAAASNAKVTPTAPGNEFFHHVNKFEREFRDSNLNSMRDDCSESFDSAYRDPTKRGLPPKKTRRWGKAWNIWGFIHRKNRGNGVERSLSESWTDMRRDGYNGSVLRSNSSVSSRHSFNGIGGFGSMRRNTMETSSHMKKRRDDFVLERNRSARYSPGHLDNGLLRFYLTPMRSSRRGSSSGMGRINTSHSFTRSVLRLY